MEAIIQKIDVERLLPIFNIPLEIRNRRVEVTIKPIESKPQTTATDRIRQFREKYNRRYANIKGNPIFSFDDPLIKVNAL